MRRLLLVVSIAVGCGPGPAAPTVEQAAAVPQPEPRAEPEAAPVVPVEAAPVVVADGKIGVAACDEYLAAYRGCIDSLGEDFRASHRKVVEQLAASWRAARADDKVAGTLAETCGSTRAASKLSLPTCAW